MKKSLVVLLALVVGFGGVSRLGAQGKRTEGGGEVVNVCVTESQNSDPVTYTVPSDRRLTIEDATYETFLVSGASVYGSLVTSVNGKTVAHTVAFLSGTNGHNYYSGARTMKAYADPGTAVSVRGRTPYHTPAYSFLCFTGRLEPLG